MRKFVETVVLTPHQITHALEKSGALEVGALLRGGLKLRVVKLRKPKTGEKISQYDLGNTLVDFDCTDVNAVLVVEITKVLDEENHPVQKGMEGAVK